MAAEVETMAYAGQVPWHGLGKKVTPDMTPEEMLQSAGLDWSVSCRKLIDPEDKALHIRSHRALVRDSDSYMLDMVGPNYIPTQNSEAASFFKKFTEAGDMKMETAGSLKHGRHIWFLADLQAGFSLAGGDEVKGYLLLSSPHQFGKALTAMFTPVRVVCNNTLTMALNTGAHRFHMPHIKAFDGDVQAQAERALGITAELMDTFKAQAELLSGKQAKVLDVQKFIASVFQPELLHELPANDVDIAAHFKPTAEKVYNALETQPGADLKSSKGTWWNAMNAVTYIVDHDLGRVRDNAVYNAWFGSTAVIKRRALENAIEFAEAA